MQPLHFFITVGLFAVVYPTLYWLFARKSFSWKSMAISIAIYAVLMGALTFTPLAQQFTGH